MPRDQQLDMSSPRMFTLSTPASSVARPTKTIEIVRAESELQAIDELMADLTDEFIAELMS